MKDNERVTIDLERYEKLIITEKIKNRDDETIIIVVGNVFSSSKVIYEVVTSNEKEGFLAKELQKTNFELSMCRDKIERLERLERKKKIFFGLITLNQ